MYGSIVKFPPSGGVIWYDPKHRLSPSVEGKPPETLLAEPALKVQAHLGYHTRVPIEVQGAEWFRFGFAPFTLTHTGSNTCMCQGAGFDVDEFGRVFYPNLGQFRVEVIDNSNNFITAFGRYGNEDDAPQGPADVVLAWPLSVAVSDTYAYVADTLNRRVVRVKLDYAAEASAAVP